MDNATSRLPFIVIEGNVGVGKSTFLGFLKHHFNAYIMYEPNQLWQNVDGHDLLGQFFLDQKRWAYTCQCYVLTTRIDQFLKEEQRDHGQYVCFSERSPYSGRYVFAQVAQEIGTLSALEWCLYKKMWDREIVRLDRNPDGFIYMRASVEVCFNRIMKRGRSEERPISMDYLKNLEEKHENWFVHQQGIEEQIARVPNLILDFSEDFEANVTLQNQYLSLIKNFIEQIKK